MTMFFDKQPVSLVDDLLPFYKPGEFASPTRSTVPLFSLLKHGVGVWTRISQLFAEEGDAIDVHVEYTVSSPQGTGIPSHTDVMLRKAGLAGALEAKWSEPRYDTVAQWLNKGTNPRNRCAVMDGWLSLLASRVGRTLPRKAFDEAVYQMVHRAASACAVGTSPAMAYLQFSPLPDNTRPNIAQLENDLGHLHALLGKPAELPFYLLDVEIRPTAAFIEISGLPKGCASTAATVKAALLNGSLFDFTASRTLRRWP